MQPFLCLAAWKISIKAGMEELERLENQSVIIAISENGKVSVPEKVQMQDFEIAEMFGFSHLKRSRFESG